MPPPRRGNAKACRATLPVRWRRVRVHPPTKRKSLFLPAHGVAASGRHVPETRVFLRKPQGYAMQPDLVYSHQWSQHDLMTSMIS